MTGSGSDHGFPIKNSSELAQIVTYLVSEPDRFRRPTMDAETDVKFTIYIIIITLRDI